MRWLVDGYNVIRRDPALQAQEATSLEAGRTALLHLLARVARERGEHFTVVFDGARRGGGAPAGGQVEVRFSAPPERADDVLMREAARLRDGAIVVTSDRTVRDAAWRSGATVVSAEQFLDALGGGEPDEEPEAADDDESPPSRGGNARRPSREARATERALRRLRHG